MKKYYDNTTRKEWKVISTPMTRRFESMKKAIRAFFSKKSDFDF